MQDANKQKIQGDGNQGQNIGSLSAQDGVEDGKKKSCSVGVSHLILKKQNAPRSQERFAKMIEKANKKKCPKSEKQDDIEFDNTQWDNTLWGKEIERTGTGSSYADAHGDDSEGRGLSTDFKSPFLPGEGFDKKTDKGAYLMRTAHLSIIIDVMELASALAAIIILVFPIRMKIWNALYPLCNTCACACFVTWLIFTHWKHLHVRKQTNAQGIMEYHIPYSAKCIFLHGHIARAGLSLISATQAVYLAVTTREALLFSLAAAVLIVQCLCSLAHLYFAIQRIFALILQTS